MRKSLRRIFRRPRIVYANVSREYFHDLAVLFYGLFGNPLQCVDATKPHFKPWFIMVVFLSKVLNGLCEAVRDLACPREL